MYDSSKSQPDRASSAPGARARAPGRAPRTARLGSPDATARAGFRDPPVEVPFRAEMERSLGADFSQVRAHVGPSASDACDALDAEAYTLGTHVAFDSPRPSKATVAHELTHVVQQSAAPSSRAASPDAHEREADTVAMAVTAGFAPDPPAVRTDRVVARRPKDPPNEQPANTIDAKLSGVNDATSAGRVAREVYTAVDKGSVEHAALARLGALVPAKHRKAFWSALTSRAASRIKAKMPTDKLPSKDIEAWPTSSGWKGKLSTWAKTIAAWRDALPAAHSKQLMKTALGRGKWLVQRFRRPNRSSHRKQKPLRDALNEALEAALGRAFVVAVYRAAGAVDLLTIDRVHARRDYESKRAAEPFDRARADTARRQVDALLPTLNAVRGDVDKAVAAKRDIANLAQAYAAQIEVTTAAIMEYKRTLKLGTGAADKKDLASLQAATAELQKHSNHLNKLRIDAEAKHIRTATGKLRQKVGDAKSAAWWKTIHVAGAEIEKHPEKISLDKTEGRTTADLDQVVLHEGGRSTKGTLDTFVDRKASSHFVVNPDGSIGQLTSVAGRAGHTPGGNAKSVGVDLNFHDGSYAGGNADAAYIDFLEKSPAQIVALSKLVLSVRGAIDPSMSLAPKTPRYGKLTPKLLDESGPGVYPHGSAKVDGKAHADPGDLTSQEYYKWVALVEKWERTYGPINVFDGGELTRLKSVMASVEAETVAEYRANEAPYVAQTAGELTSVKTRKKNFVLTIEPKSDAPAGKQAKQKPTKVEIPRRTKHGKVRLTVDKGDAITAVQALVHVNPYDDAQRGLFTAKVDKKLASLGT